jgi:alkylation response protein AidB-like acyl-CoA dehydrogenase
MTSTIDLNAIVDELGPRFAATAAEHDENDRFVADNYDALRERRVFSALVPAELGGGGVSYGELCRFLTALARHCGSTALALSMHSHLVAAAVANFRAGRPGQKLLERVAADEAILVSTGARDWMESNGTVERAEGGFRVSARKAFASGSPKGTILVTSAPYEDPDAGWQVLHFPVPFSAEGVSLADDWRTLGMRATGSHTVILDRVFVPEEAIVLRRPQGQYHMVWNVVLTVAMPLIMSVYLGVAESAAELARGFLAKRADDPTSSPLMGEIANLATTAKLAVADMIRITNEFDFEPAVETANAILIRKTIAANAVIACADKALAGTAGPGFYRSFGLERFVRDAHGAQFHPLPEARQRLFTGRLALGLDPVSGLAPAAAAE